MHPKEKGSQYLFRECIKAGRWRKDHSNPVSWYGPEAYTCFIERGTFILARLTSLQELGSTMITYKVLPLFLKVSLEQHI
jgi:hypothetical protein